MVLGLTFNESLGLVLVTALVTGVVAPMIVGVTVGITNRRRLNEQKHYEEELKRETTFVEAQTEFLKDLSAAIWDFLEKALAVSYAGMEASARYQEVWDDYDKESFGLLGRIGSQVSMAGVFVSSETAQRLDDFYRHWLEGDFELGLSGRAKNPETTPDEWRAWHIPVHHEAQDRASALIKAVADEAQLTYEHQRRRSERPPGFVARVLGRVSRGATLEAR